MNYPVLINGTTYHWSEITTIILTKPVVGITGIKYSDKTEMKNVYGAGGRVIARGYGNEEAEASVTLLLEEVRELIKIAPNRRLSEIPPFDIIVVYTPTPSRFCTDVIKNCQFLDTNIDWKQNDTSKEVELKLITSNIEWGEPPV